jgi:L-alanine-DL-glutamate epimerase-like enolase superfamily enzyme
MMAEDPIENGLHYLPNGVVTIDDTPGIGASIDTAYLKSLEQAIIQ